MHPLKKILWGLVALVGAMALGMITTTRGEPTPAAWLAGTAETSAKLVEVRVVGSQRYSEAEIVRAIGLKIGTKVAPANFKEVADKLAAAAVFTDVRYRYTPRSDGIAVEFRVTDASQFIPCRFENFVWFSAQELQHELRSRVPLFTGEVPPAGNLSEQLTAALDSLLKQRGVQGTVRHQNSAERPGGPVDAILFSADGASIHIVQVKFEGVTELDVSTLQAAMKPLIGTDYVQSYVSRFAHYNLGPIYGQRGYLQAGFGSPTAELTREGDAKDSVTVTIPVREGLRYRLAGLQWTGNKVFPGGELTKNIHLAVGEPANAVQLQLDLESIHDLYGTRGYLAAAVQPEPAFQDEARTVTYNFQVHEGDLYRMGKLEILGLDPSHAEALKRSCQLATGDPFDVSYWKKFLSQAGRYLPRIPGAWKVDFRQSIDPATKTVDVAISYTLTPRTNQ